MANTGKRKAPRNEGFGKRGHRDAMQSRSYRGCGCGDSAMRFPKGSKKTTVGKSRMSAKPRTKYPRPSSDRGSYSTHGRR